MCVILLFFVWIAYYIICNNATKILLSWEQRKKQRFVHIIPGLRGSLLIFYIMIFVLYTAAIQAPGSISEF
jgi:hypothetical protein